MIKTNMHIILLSEANDAVQSGGKASHLARAAGLGFPVPRSLVLTREALKLFLDGNGLAETVQSLLAGYQKLDWSSRIQQFEHACVKIRLAAVPPAVQEAVNPAVALLLKKSPAGLAVRSSSVCEDLEKASFAGIYESFLGVFDLTGFWQNIVRCWCSAWSPKAAAYAQKMGLALPVDGMAVLIQQAIAARSAGVIFTADPATGNPWQFVLNSTFGLAPELMDGSVPADRFVLEWGSGEILERQIRRKPEATLLKEGKLVKNALADTQQLSASLKDHQVKAIGRMALDLDRAFNRRMDIEWALDGEQLWLVQARPLTCLPPFFPHELSREEAEETWLLMQERPLAPIARDDLLLEMWDRFLTPDDIFPRRVGMERVINGYYYSTEWKWKGNPSGYDRQGIERWLDANERRLRQEWLAQLEAAHQANAWLDETIERTTRAVDWVRISLEFERKENEMHAAVWYAVQWMIFTCEDLIKRFIEEVLPGSGIEDLPGSLMQGLSCYSVERTAAAQDLGREVQEVFVREAFAGQPLHHVVPFLLAQHPGCRFLKDLSSLYRRFGLEVPRGGKKDQQAMDGEGLLLVIKNRLLSQGAGMRDVKDVLASGARKRQAIEEQVRSYIRSHRPDQLERFNKLLDWAQFWTPALDNRKWHCSMSLRLADLFQRTGEALVAERLIEQPEDFKLLTKEDWAAYVQDPDEARLYEVYRRSKSIDERNRRLEPLPYLGKPPAQESKIEAGARQPAEGRTTRLHPQPATNKVIQGQGIAPGKGRGVAYKIFDMEVTDYADGLTGDHILICAPERFPAQWRRDWYSLLMVVCGLVIVQCSQLSHATQIARECGVPLVNLADEDFYLLPDRVEIEIDGREGTVTVL